MRCVNEQQQRAKDEPVLLSSFAKVIVRFLKAKFYFSVFSLLFIIKISMSTIWFYFIQCQHLIFNVKYQLKCCWTTEWLEIYIQSTCDLYIYSRGVWYSYKNMIAYYSLPVNAMHFDFSWFKLVFQDKLDKSNAHFIFLYSLSSHLNCTRTYFTNSAYCSTVYGYMI